MCELRELMDKYDPGKYWAFETCPEVLKAYLDGKVVYHCIDEKVFHYSLRGNTLFNYTPEVVDMGTWYIEN